MLGGGRLALAPEWTGILVGLLFGRNWLLGALGAPTSDQGFLEMVHFLRFELPFLDQRTCKFEECKNQLKTTPMDRSRMHFRLSNVFLGICFSPKDKRISRNRFGAGSCGVHVCGVVCVCGLCCGVLMQMKLWCKGVASVLCGGVQWADICCSVTCFRMGAFHFIKRNTKLMIFTVGFGPSFFMAQFQE